MKKLITIILSVLLIASLFVSCDNATKAVQDELAEVTLSTQAIGRSLTVSNPLEALNNIDWYYTAEKLTECQFNYGATSTQKYINLFGENNENRLTLSQGKWKFELFGYVKQANPTVNPAEGASVLYYGVVDEALILRDNGINQITVEVSPYTSAKGKISFNNVKLDRHDGEDISPNYLYVTGPNGYSKTYTTFNGTEDLIDLNAGQYTVTVAWKETMTGDNPATPAVEDATYKWDLVIASETIVVTVYGGRTTEIRGNISEETGSGTIQGEYVDENTSVVVGKVEEGKDLVLVSSVAPANSVTSNKVENTTVTFAKNVFTSDQTAILKVEVKDISTSIVDSSFTVEDGKSAVAGISLTLTVGETIHTGNFGNAVIETYIAKDLSNVQVKYKGNGTESEPGNMWVVASADSSKPSTNYYESYTGKLVFTTTHFSEYYVVADEVVAINDNKNTVYTDIQEAVDNANAGETISLINNINLEQDLALGTGDRGVNLNLNGKTINGGTHQVYTAGNGTTTIFGDGVITNTNSTQNADYAPLWIYAGSNVVLDGVKVSGNYCGVNNSGNLTIKKATIEGTTFGLGCFKSCKTSIGDQGGNDSDVTITAKEQAIATAAGTGLSDMVVNVYCGTFTSTGTEWDDCPAYWAGHGTLNVYGGTFSNHTTSTQAAAIYQKNGTINIYDGVFSSRAGVKLGAEESNSISINLNIYGGKIEGTNHAALYYKTTAGGSKCTAYNIKISGGKFTGSDPYGAIYASTKPGVIIPSVQVTGGTFSTDPLKYVPFGYDVEQVDGKYVVSLVTDDIPINNVNQLMQFAASVNAGNYYAGKTITLNSDIDLEGKTWVPIGEGNRKNRQKVFKGIFKGNGKTIKNLSSNGYDPSTVAVNDDGDMLYAYGLFGIVEGATIQNVKFENISIDTAITVNDTTYKGDSVGAVVGYAFKNATITDCEVLSGSINGHDAVAGIVGRAYGEKKESDKFIISGCINSADISATKGKSAGIVGIIANVNGSLPLSVIDECVNNGDITVGPSGYSGGIIGAARSTDISDSTNTGNITSSTSVVSVGGIVGDYAHGGTISNTNNSGAITITGNANTLNYGIGGIAGWVRYNLGDHNQTLTCKLYNCENTGNISVTGNTGVGGVVGQAYWSVEIIGCKNTNADIRNPSGNMTGAILGGFQYIYYKDSGLPDENYSSLRTNTLTIKNCTASGSVISTGVNTNTLVGHAPQDGTETTKPSYSISNNVDNVTLNPSNQD